MATLCIPRSSRLIAFKIVLNRVAKPEGIEFSRPTTAIRVSRDPELKGEQMAYGHTCDFSTLMDKIKEKYTLVDAFYTMNVEPSLLTCYFTFALSEYANVEARVKNTGPSLHAHLQRLFGQALWKSDVWINPLHHGGARVEGFHCTNINCWNVVPPGTIKKSYEVDFAPAPNEQASGNSGYGLEFARA